MVQGKSLLNPYATPYVPVSKIMPGVSSEGEKKATQKMLGDSENNEFIERSAEYKLPDSVSVDYDIQCLEKHRVSDESSTKIGVPWNSGDTFQDVIHIGEKQSAMDDPNLIMESLSSMFPDISIESLVEFLYANHGDLNQTIDVLEQLEYEGDEVENSTETPQSSNSFDDPLQKG